MSDEFGPAALAATQGIVAFNIFLPRFTDVRRNNPKDNPDFAGDVRTGEVAAAVVTLGIGLMASYLTNSRMPMVAALFICLVLIALYESVLRANNPLEARAFTLEEIDNA